MGQGQLVEQRVRLRKTINRLDGRYLASVRLLGKEIQDNNKMTSIQSMLGIGGTGAAGGAEGKTEEDD